MSPDDFSNITIDNVFINRMYNDLGFIVRNRLIILVEAQSTWTENICLRLLLYLAETYVNYVRDNKIILYDKKKVSIPMPELYVVYTGGEEVPDVISLNDSFFDGKSSIDAKVKVISKQETSTIFGQYITFCKVFDNLYKKLGDPKKAIEEAINICLRNGVLSDYLYYNKKEVCRMISVLHDEEFLTEAVLLSTRNAGKAEGIEIGMKKGKAEGKAEGRIEASVNVVKRLLERGSDISEACLIADIDERTYNRYMNGI